MQTSHSTHLCLSKHATLISACVCLCVCLCVYISEGELCKWPVCTLLSASGPQGDLQETSPLKLRPADFRPHFVCESRPGRDKQFYF